MDLYMVFLDHIKRKHKNMCNKSRKIRECLVPYFLEAMALGRLVAHLHPKLKLVEQDLLKTHAFPASIEVRKSSSIK